MRKMAIRDEHLQLGLHLRLSWAFVREQPSAVCSFRFHRSFDHRGERNASGERDERLVHCAIPVANYLGTVSAVIWRRPNDTDTSSASTESTDYDGTQASGDV
jgi:hypothetical protein